MARRASDKIPHPEVVRRLLDYDPMTGILTWKYRTELEGTKASGWNARYAGTEAGSIDGGGYINVSIHKLRYPSHVLAWVITYGAWPADQLDHKNLNKADNRLLNLREANAAENGWNVGLTKRNKSGIKGVNWHKASNAWIVRIAVNGHQKYLGTTDDFELACIIRAEAAAKYHGEFAFNG